MLPNLPLVLTTSDNDLTSEFYEPCLHWATRYDRGVGYFTSGWLRVNAQGLTSFASRGGKARWLTSPILDQGDINAFQQVAEEGVDTDLVTILRSNVEQLRSTLERDTLNALAWMIYDGVIEMRFAVPVGQLEGGDFHDKFGVFEDEEGNCLSFNGSQNDSRKGTINYESIKVFPSWRGLGDFAADDKRRFERLWKGLDPNIRSYTLPEAVASEIFRARTADRPYQLPNRGDIPNKWRHQDEAIARFLESSHGILEMATGTGKTKTAIRIAERLRNDAKIDWILVTTFGTDLLDQWYRELITDRNLPVFRQYSSYRDISRFLLSQRGVLIVSRMADSLTEALRFLPRELRKRGLLICDEVHGLGSDSLIKALSGELQAFGYRLGLSATPERVYDEEGNKFIEDEIGGVIYQFGLEQAIERGILCEFDYIRLAYSLTSGDRQKMRNLYAAHNARKAQGHRVDDTDLFQALAMVKKVSPAKLPVFAALLEKQPDLLRRSIIFVGTKAFGLEVQDILINYLPEYHTYFGEDDRENLRRFARGELDCLITSHRISEGIDIRSVDNIILFASDRSRLETTQRIGRSLRVDPNNPAKRATVVDFVAEDTADEVDGEPSADEERAAWLTQLSAVRRRDS